MARLIFVRHGESRATIDRVIGGPRTCQGLTDLGRRQCEALARRWAAIRNARRVVTGALEIERANKAIGIKEEPDFFVYGGGTLYMLLPKSEAAKAWVSENLPADAQTLGRAIAIEHRYIGPILDGINDAGLVVEG